MDQNTSVVMLADPARQTDRKLAYNYREACDMLGIAKTTLYDLVLEGRLQPVKMGRINLFLADDLKGFLASLPKRTGVVRPAKRAA